MNRVLKLNLGSGDKRIDGFLNVDYSEECKPDIVMNLEQVPWNFDDDSVSHIIMNRVLEHIGQTPQNFLSIMKELYRICQNGALVDITVPHPSHDNFLSDPTHVRPITHGTLALFDREENLRWRQMRLANSPLALQCQVNFKIIKFQQKLDRQVIERLKKLEQKDPFLLEMFLNYGRNVMKETYFQLRVIK